jgi:hypothetical protein
MALATDSICISASPLNMVGVPVGGTFYDTNGTTISGSEFNPNEAGGGAHYIYYSYYDADSECLIETAPEFLEVLYAPVELFVANDTVCVFETVVMLTGLPAGGFYTGIGVSGNQFYPSIAGSGVHMVTYNYVDPQGCTNRAVRPIYVDDCGGVSEIAQDTHWKVFPNPATNFIKVQSDNFQLASYRIFSMDGKCVLNGTLFNGNTLNIQSLASGVYSLQISGDQKTENYYFVKE